MEYLIVDGYNIIGASPELNTLSSQNLEEARYQLQELLSEYSSYTKRTVIIIYDAHLTASKARTKITINNIEVRFTKKGETADEYIEKLVGKITNYNNKVYVATSDALEQRLIFGKGALRISARELLIEIKMIRDEISEDIKNSQQKVSRIDSALNPQIAKIFEEWRRKK